MNSYRPASDQNKAILRAILEKKPSTRSLVNSLEGLLVQDLQDGGMGSLLLLPKGSEGGLREFGKQIALAEFVDRDGTPVSVAINVDKQERLFELDIWKVNFGPLKQWPEPSMIVTVS
jgi:hypothetical protein